MRHLSGAVESHKPFHSSILRTARAIFAMIGEKLDDPKNCKSWNLEKYHEKKLRELYDKRLAEPSDVDVDSFFVRCGSVKAAVVLRLAAKEILVEVRKLPAPLRLKLIQSFDSLSLHSQISEWINRFERSIRFATETAKSDSLEQRDKSRKKRELGLQHRTCVLNEISLTLNRDRDQSRCDIKQQKAGAITE